MRHAIIAVLLLTALAGTAVAGPFEDANSAFERGDYATVLRLLRPLAEQGHSDAQYSLGIMYNQGRGVPQDYVLAHMWFNLAASRLEAEKRNEAVKNRDIIASRMTPAQIAKAQRLALEWKPK